MLSLSAKNMRKIMVIITGCFVLITVLFGIKLGMMTDEDGRMMEGCPFMNEEGALCQMSIMEHFARWETLLAAVHPEILVAFLLALYVVTRGFRGTNPEREHAVPRTHERHRHPEIRLFNPFLFAFSDGII